MSVHVKIQIGRTNPLSFGLELVTALAKELEELKINYTLEHPGLCDRLEFELEGVAPPPILADLLADQRVTQIHWQRNGIGETIQSSVQSVDPKTPITELGLSLRTGNTLAREGEVRTLDDLLATSDRQLSSIPGIGAGSQAEIRQLLADLNLDLASHPRLSPEADLKDQQLYCLPKLPTRLFHILRRSGITTIAELTQLSLDEFMEIEGLSRNSAAFIRELMRDAKLIPADLDPKELLIEELKIGTRAYNLLKRAGAVTFQDLLDLGDKIGEIDGMTEQLQAEVKQAAKQYGYDLETSR